MNKFILFSDLDGTLISSAKNKRPGDIVIERKNGEEITCITSKQAKILPKLSDAIVPLTSRSIEQYARIEIAGFRPKYALCSNGGTLLVDGVPDKEWQARSFELCGGAASELEHFRELLERDPRRSFEVRFVDGLFLFTKSSEPQKTLRYLGQGELCGGFVTNQKVYVIPRALGKGEAVKRFAERFGIAPLRIVCAGDTMMDVTMLNAAKTVIFTDNIPENAVTASEKIIRPREGFPEFVTEFAEERCL